MIEHGADVNLGGSAFGLRPLHLAASSNDIAKVLIQNGASVDIRTTKIRHHFIWLVLMSRKSCFLNGADMNALDNEKRTPLFHAAEQGRVACALHLICFGAKIDKNTIRYDTTCLISSINDKLNYVRKGCRSLLRGKTPERERERERERDGAFNVR